MTAGSTVDDDARAIATALRAAASPVFAFDFDGTLAPLVPRPEWARVPPDLAATLADLASRHPVAIITGRKIDDVRHRLGFEPRTIVGSHGAEWTDDPAFGATIARRLDVARLSLLAHAEELTYAGVAIEDKQQSIALHYRRAPNAMRAVATIERCTDGLPGDVECYPGNCVVNIVARGAPTKADAIRRLLRECGGDALLFAGDDTNDEPVFDADEPSWHTIRVGTAAVHARYIVESPEGLGDLLRRLAQHLVRADG